MKSYMDGLIAIYSTVFYCNFGHFETTSFRSSFVRATIIRFLKSLLFLSARLFQNVYLLLNAKFIEIG